MYNHPLCPTDLGIIMSYKCQSACKHCRYNCGPKWKDRMSSETLKEALSATRAWIHRFHIHFTGFDLYRNYISWFRAGLTMGDWHNLQQILNDFKASHFPPIVEILVKKGPFGLFEVGKEEYGYEEMPEGYTGKCHLCIDVRKHLSRQEDFHELKPREFYEYI